MILRRRARPDAGARAVTRQPRTPRIVYFAHDLSDPAVRRRVRMFKEGGATVLLAGFRRSAAPVTDVEGLEPVDLGRTRNLQLVSRIGSVGRAVAAAWALSLRSGPVDCVVARNLETLVLARVFTAVSRGAPRLVYEVLDIHRLMCGEGRASRVLRGVERHLARSVYALLVSSPAFLEAYFRRRWPSVPRALLVENKVLDPCNARAEPGDHAGGPPWRIGWFGMLRCQRSLDVLCALAAGSGGRVQIDIRGRPTLELFRDFHGQIAATPNVSYLGPYQPGELPDHYAATHFAWAIDFYEEGWNSAWLLPNRLYESLYMGAVPIALQAVETGRWLRAHGAGLLVNAPERELAARLNDMSPAAYRALAGATAAVPDSALIDTPHDCRAMVAALCA